MDRKIVIVGDLHLDKTRRVTYGDPSLWNDKPFQLLQEIVTTEAPDILIIPGDIFDKYNPDSLSVIKFINIVKLVPNVFLLEGNHDRPRVEKPYCMLELAKFSNIKIIGRNTFDLFNHNIGGIGWCDTQEIFIEKLTEASDILPSGSILCLHCNHYSYGNEMDNYIPESFITKFYKENISIFAGHDHTFYTDRNYIGIGAIIPNNIGELGVKKYWTNTDGFKIINHKVGDDITKDDVILLREEPLYIDENKAYYVKPKGSIDIKDIELEAKDLHIDIIEDFIKEARGQGFDTAYINKFLGALDDN